VKVEIWPLARIIPYARNARKIPEKAVTKVAASLKEFGWRQPIVVDSEGVIIVGHVRRAGAERLGWTEAPVHVADGLTPAQVKAYRLMANRSHQETDWEPELLALEFADLKALDIDLSLTWFEPAEIEGLLGVAEGCAPEDEVPEAGPAVTRPGDLWCCGPHRVLCGDATNREDVGRLLGERKPFLMVTDPPYGVEYDPKWRLETGLNKLWQTRAEGRVTNDGLADWSVALGLFPGDVAYVWHAGRHASEVAIGLHFIGFEIRNQIIWAKTSLVIGRGNYHWQHEPCWYSVRKGEACKWRGDRKQSTLWQVPNMHRTQGDVDDGKTAHSTQKPVELMRRPILNHTLRGEEVYDPFLGSGSTLIAAQSVERVCYGLEIEPAYCDIIVRRWQKFAGGHATLEGDGRTFAEIEAERSLSCHQEGDGAGMEKMENAVA
jgi:DNA modification methylase